MPPDYNVGFEQTMEVSRKAVTAVQFAKLYCGTTPKRFSKERHKFDTIKLVSLVVLGRFQVVWMVLAPGLMAFQVSIAVPSIAIA